MILPTIVRLSQGRCLSRRPIVEVVWQICERKSVNPAGLNHSFERHGRAVVTSGSDVVSFLPSIDRSVKGPSLRPRLNRARVLPDIDEVCRRWW